MRHSVFCLLILITMGTSAGAQDFHSYGNPSAVRVTHVDLDWDVLFDQKILKGSATLTVERTSQTEPLILDTRELQIEKVETSGDGRNYLPGTFTVGASDSLSTTERRR